MIDVKNAANIAKNYFSDIYQNKYQNLILEEVEISDDDNFWYITFSYNEPGLAMLGEKLQKQYKTFKIDADTGKIISMKVRKI